MTDIETETHEHVFIQKVDKYDRLRWHECKVCKQYEECNCSEEEFDRRLQEASEILQQQISTNAGMREGLSDEARLDMLAEFMLDRIIAKITRDREIST